MRAEQLWLLVASAALLWLVVLQDVRLGPNIIGPEEDIQLAVDMASTLRNGCADVQVSPLALALMATEAVKRDHFDRILDLIVKRPWLAYLIGYEQFSLGLAQIKPATLAKFELVPAGELYSASVNSIENPCVALAYTDALVNALATETSSCFSSSQIIKEAVEVCVISHFNGQRSLNRQNFAYLSFVQNVSSKLN